MVVHWLMMYFSIFHFYATKQKEKFSYINVTYVLTWIFHVILCLSFPTFRNLMLTLDITFLTSTLGHILFQNEFYLVALKFVAINMNRVFILGYANEYGSNITAVQRFVPLFMTIQHMNILMFHNVNFCFPFMYTIGSFYCRSTFLNEKPIVLSGGRYLRKRNWLILLRSKPMKYTLFA